MLVTRARVSRAGKFSDFATPASRALSAVQSTLRVGWYGREIFALATCSLQFAKQAAPRRCRRSRSRRRTTRQMRSGEGLIYPALSIQWQVGPRDEIPCPLPPRHSFPSSQVITLPKAKSPTCSEQNKDMHKFRSVYSGRGVLLPVLTSGGE
jgi:hypothetical protein